MKKLLILVMLLSMGLAGIASAERGKFTFYRWDNGDTGTTVQQYQRNFSTVPTSQVTVTRSYVFPVSNTVSTGGLETPTWENGDNNGGRFDGWLLPPADGKYTFWISSDDASELWLSTDDQSANAVKICGVSGWANQRAWTTEAGQKSAEITLSANKAYFFYGAWKEGGGGDGMSIAWGCPQAFIVGPTVIDMNYVSNTPTGFVTGLNDMPGAVEYDLWDPPANGDVSVYGVVNGIMPDFSTMPAPTSQGTLVTFGVGPMAGTDDFIYRQYGIIKVAADGVMSFATSSDDGSKLYVGNWWTSGAPLTLVVNNDGWHGMQYRSASVPVTAGYVGIVVEMFEDGGGEGLEVYYYSDTIPAQQIPASALLSRKVANTPSPASGAMGVALGTALSWTKPVFKDGVTNKLMFAESGQPLAQVYSGTGTSFTPALAADKYYAWRVDTTEPNLAGPNPIITMGRVWGFSTAAAPVAKKLVAYWPLDADLADATGNLLPGKYNSNDSSAPVFEPGMKGNALAINIADTTNAQYAKLADYGVPALSTTGISGNMPRTISCWVKPAVVPVGSASNWCNIFGFTSLQGAGGYVFDFNKFGGNEQYCITRYGGDWFMANIDADWHHLTATYDANRTISWYADGKFVNQATGQDLFTQDIVHIGKRASSTPLWRGWVDEARVYNYAMTAQEVYQLYLTDGGTPSATPLCFGPYPAYDFDKNCVVDTGDLIEFAKEWLKNGLVN